MKYRIRYEKELKMLKLNLLKMCNLVSSQIQKAVSAMMESDVELALKVAEDDRLVNEIEHEIEKQCLDLLLKEQPVARDFREVFSSLKMITDLERIGDQAEDIARLVTGFSKKHLIQQFEYIAQMADVALEMVTGSVNAFIKQDLQLAEQVVKKDDILDYLFIKVRSDLSDKIREHTQSADDIISMIMIAKYLERIGDHAVNICEWTRYYESGER